MTGACGLQSVPSATAEVEWLRGMLNSVIFEGAQAWPPCFDGGRIGLCDGGVLGAADGTVLAFSNA